MDVPNRLVPDPRIPGAFLVAADGSSQSWVDPDHPLDLAFEYVQRIAEVLDATVLELPDERRARVVHLGGGGLTIPRWLEARRPHTAQIVCEPDADLMVEVRRKLPLPRQSGIKVREVDGRSGLAAMPDDYADAIVLDAFVGFRVPAELATAEFFQDAARVLRPGGVFVANMAEQAPFAWSRRAVAGIPLAHVAVSAEAAVWKGRRYGNLIACASDTTLPMEAMIRSAAAAPFSYRWRFGTELVRWLAGAVPFSDTDAEPSPRPASGRSWFG